MKYILTLFFITLIVSIESRYVLKDGICRGLSMSGGGDRGTYESGVIVGLINHQQAPHNQWDVVAGISAGGLNAAMLAMFKKGDEQRAAKYITDSVFSLRKEDFFKHWPGSVLEGFFLRSGLIDSSQHDQTIARIYNISAIRESDRYLEIFATDYREGKIVGFNNTYPHFAKALKASIAIPIAFPLVFIEGRPYMDGGLLLANPILTVIKKCYDLGAKEVLVDVVYTYDKPEVVGGDEKIITPEVIMRTFSILTSKITHQDLIQAPKLYPKAKLRFITPSQKLPGSLIGFDPEKMQQIFKIGVEDARKAVMKNKWE
jgi:predicted patatin/cPLA2 family phospholipase